MNQSFIYQPWGDSVASGISAICFAGWIGTANLFLIVLFITNPKLLNSRQNIVILHNTVADLTVGVFYCPLAAEYYLRGFWAHGCNSFFVWFTFAFPLCFLTSHSVLMLLVLRIIPLCCRNAASTVNRSVINLAFSLTFVMVWTYLIAIAVYISTSRNSEVHITIAPTVSCHALVVNDRTDAIDLLVYFFPASISIILLVAIAVREKTSMEIPRTQLQLDSNTEELNGMSLSVITAFTLLTCLLPLPSFLATSLMVRGDSWCQSAVSSASSSMHHTNGDCFHWLGALAAMADWLLLAKSGIIPLILVTVVGDFRSALHGVLHNFRRLPTSDQRDLLTPIEDAGTDNDLPFSSI